MKHVEINETPMRQQYLIYDAKMLKLVQTIFDVLDQSWSDAQAFDVSKLIERYIKGNEK
jgi:hypothetical protein